MAVPVPAPGRLRPFLARTFAALGHRDYRIFFAGHLLSVVGLWMQSVALGWLVLLLTGSPLLLGVVAAARSLPVLLFGFGGGIASDRYDRRRLLLLANGSAAVLSLVLAVLTITGAITVPVLVALAFLLGATNALEIPARQSFVVELTGREHLANAIALNSLLFNGARVVGPALAGLLVAAAGPGLAFAINAVSYVPVLAALVVVRAGGRPAEPPRVRGAFGQTIAYLREEPRVASILALLAANTIFASGLLYLGPAIAADLGQDAEGFGALMSASGLGAVAGGLALAFRAGGIEGRWRGLLAAAVVLGVAQLGIAVSPGFEVTLLLAAAVGWGWVSVNALSNTLVQSIVRDDLRGRVMSLYTLVLLGFMPAGSILLGAVGDVTSSATAIGVGGGAWLVATLVAFLARPELRTL